MRKPTETREPGPMVARQPSKICFLAAALAGMLMFTVLRPAAAAPATESLENITATVSTFVERQYPGSGDLRIKVGRLDPRLRLRRCAHALESTWAPGSARLGQATVAVRCAGARPWKLYVPVRIARQRKVAVTTRPMARGERISNHDLVLESRTLGQQRTAIVLDPRRVQGYTLKYAVAAGKILTARMLDAPKLVRRGHRVVMTAASQGLNIQMKGIALEDGLLGDTIKVRNPASRRVLYATVIATGQVRTGTP